MTTINIAQPHKQEEYVTHERETKVYFSHEAIENLLLEKAREIVGYTGENVYAEIETVERSQEPCRGLDIRVWVAVVEQLGVEDTDHEGSGR